MALFHQCLGFITSHMQLRCLDPNSPDSLIGIILVFYTKIADTYIAIYVTLCVGGSKASAGQYVTGFAKIVLIHTFCILRNTTLKC